MDGPDTTRPDLCLTPNPLALICTATVDNGYWTILLSLFIIYVHGLTHDERLFVAERQFLTRC